jgi:hypothetical protein
MKKNVISIGQFKELKEVRRSEEAYGLYLKTLGNGQLESEVNYLLNECTEDYQSKNLYLKSRLILLEIGSRTSGNLKRKIQLMHDESLKLL